MSEVIVAAMIALISVWLGYGIGYARGWNRLGEIVSECARQAHTEQRKDQT